MSAFDFDQTEPGPPRRRREESAPLWPWVLAAGGSLLFLVAMLALLSSRGPGQRPSTRATPAERRPGRGDEVWLRVPGEAEVWVAADEPALQDVVKFSRARDTTGVRQLAERGRLFITPFGTRARLIELGLFSCEVRLLDGPHRGQLGIIQPEFITTEVPSR